MTLEPTGKVATSVVEGLKNNPSCLAAIVLAAIFSVLIYIASQREAERAQARLVRATDLIDRCIANGNLSSKDGAQ